MVLRHLWHRLKLVATGAGSAGNCDSDPANAARSLAPGVDDALWTTTLAELPWLAQFGPDIHVRLRALAGEFLARKTISGAAGFEVNDAVRAAIAIQACLPALRLGIGAYDDFVEIIVYPDRFRVQREVMDDTGVVHASDEILAGEAMEQGPVVLSWSDAAPAASAEGWNVVIHEFAHKIDLLDGEADGVPPLPSAAARAAWRDEIEGAWEGFVAMLERVEASIPRHIDPESAQGEAWYASLPLDPYAATDPAEFFAVAVEAFFVAPEPLAEVFPGLYRKLEAYFGIDPR